MKLRYISAIVLTVAVSAAYGKELRNHDKYYEAAPVAVKPGQLDRLDGRVASMDEQRGVPTFIWADRISPTVTPHQTAIPAARWYLGRHAHAYRLNKRALSTVYVSGVHDTGRGGIIVSFRQRVDGVEVVRNELNVLMKRDFSLVAITGNLHEAAAPQSLRYGLSTEAAVARALGDLSGAAVSAANIDDSGSRSEGGYGYYNVVDQSGLIGAGVQMSEPARARRVLYPLPNRLVPGYYVELMTSKPGSVDVRGQGYIISADDGQVLRRASLTQSDVFTYRVWAETAGYNTPADGPEEDYTPHPTGIAWSGYVPAYVSPVLIGMEGFNTNPMGAADPWLPAGATVTTGNNVDAYADLVAPDGFNAGDIRADVTAANTFDYVYNPNRSPDFSDSQRKAAVTQLFYTNNWLHDYFYDSGFDEASGNAQLDNYGRGGIPGDPLRAQAQDYSGTNNANMSTPADGASPRMQMYVWSGPSQSSLSALGTTFTTGTASWGPQTFNISGNIVLAVDGMGMDPNDGCEAISTNLTGSIALIHRGNCNFTVKVENAQARGAVGVIISNNAPLTGPPGMGGTPTGVISIGTLSITYEAGQMLESALSTPPVPGTLFRGPADVNRDGTIDNAIVAHEWGHYIHNRLTDCSSQQCGGEGEGWGDFMALHTIVREGDDLSGAFAVAGYSTAILGDSTYFGIRRVPYSANPAYNALSLRHIQAGEALPATHPLNGTNANNPEVHNAGEIWTSILFQGYTALLGQTVGPMPTATFEDVRRRMADYIVMGMKLAPVDATYSEQLDAILAAALAQNAGDHALLLQAFADRGAGSCSESPPRYSTDLVGVVEDIEVRGALEIISVAVDDSIDSCDLDGNLDAGERGNLIVTVGNPGDAELTNTSIMVTASNANVSFPTGTTANIASIMPGATATASIEVIGAGTLSMPDSVQIDVMAMNTNACNPTLMDTATVPLHFDFVQSTADGVESPVSAWAADGTVPTNWRRAIDMDMGGNHVWYGQDLGSPSDTHVTSPAINVDTTGNFVLVFSHRYRFEFDATTWWDGGVIEISTNNGTTWNDISAYAAPGYNGVLTTISGNPLGGRMAFSGLSPMWPNFNTVTLDLGTGLQGQVILLRFRIGTDAAVGDYGWEVDNIAVVGATNLPFIEVGPDNGGCNPPPVADAGLDQTVNGGDTVTLDGSQSYDPEGEALNFLWSQTAGPAVTLMNPDTAVTTFVAPNVAVDTVLAFDLTVDDGVYLATDTVNVTILADVVEPDAGVPDAGPIDPDAAPIEPDAGPIEPDAGPIEPDAGTTPPPPPGDDGCCQTSGPPSTGNLALLGLVMFGIAVVTRRRRSMQR